MRIQKLTYELQELLQSMVDQEATINEITAQIHANYRLSAKNLCRYILLRSKDMRKYHDSLSDYGLSSLASSEGYVYSGLLSVVKNLSLIQGLTPAAKTPEITIIGYKKSKKLLKNNTEKLFKTTHKNHFINIMVTLPNEAADDKSILQKMVAKGMKVARINLSHGDKAIWTKMLQNIEEINQTLEHKIVVYMDLSGPKLRTAPIHITTKKGIVKRGIPIRIGECLVLTKEETTGRKSRFDANNQQVRKSQIGVLLPQIIDDVQLNDRVLFDDGMIEAVVIAKTHQTVELHITKAYKNKLGSEKGINLPDTKLHLPALTPIDIENLPFVCKHADIVGYSFVRTPEDIQYLYTQLHLLNATNLGVVFKIENKEAFENVPLLLLEGMKRECIGVMIARGDLAVEIGFERISEVQNQILWLCEAAHIPVIWATQVLDNLAKSGIPTRAEISDVVQGVQSECIMLNKGPFIYEAIEMLKNILVRMKAHSFKKKNALRPLNIAIKAKEHLF